jgi:hypothetical protein
MGDGLQGGRDSLLLDIVKEIMSLHFQSRTIIPICIGIHIGSVVKLGLRLVHALTMKAFEKHPAAPFLAPTLVDFGL